MENILPALTALIVLAIGLLFGYFALRNIFEQIQTWRMARQSRAWTSTSGVIQTSEIIYEGVRSPRSQPRLIYTYQVNGVRYQGNRINFSFGQIFFKVEAAKVIALYPLHAAVTVYYDPAQPAQSTLEQRHADVVSGLLIGLVVFLPTCLCLAAGIMGLTETLGK